MTSTVFVVQTWHFWINVYLCNTC